MCGQLNKEKRLQKTFFFIRHGQSLANAGGKVMPDANIPLTDTGKQQAKKLCERWEKSRDLPLPKNIFSSQFLRAKQTANAFCDAYALTAQEIPLLNEFSYLSFSNIKELTPEARISKAQTYWQTANLTYRDGSDSDSFNDFLSRVSAFNQTVSEYPNHSLFFGHGIWIALLTWQLLGHRIDHTSIQNFRQFQKALPMHNTIVYELKLHAGLTQIKKVAI